MHLKVYCQSIENSITHNRPADVVVFHGFTESFVNRLPYLYDDLSDREKARADRFRNEIDYNCYVAAHALLRIELSKIINIKAKAIAISETEYGKPFLSGIDLPFNLSRAKELFAFVIGRSNQYVGIDIEQIKPEIDFIGISNNYFNQSEQQVIVSRNNQEDQKRTFFEIWTRKEALLKAVGIGITCDLTKVEVLDGENHLSLVGRQVSHHYFKVASVLKKDAVISVASSADFIPEFKNLSFTLF
jgi:phosphopantetheinyl transferase